MNNSLLTGKTRMSPSVSSQPRLISRGLLQGSFNVPIISYASTTRSITVIVRPIYLDEPSDLLGREFAFGYAISIENTGSAEVQLLQR